MTNQSDSGFFAGLKKKLKGIFDPYSTYRHSDIKTFDDSEKGLHQTDVLNRIDEPVKSRTQDTSEVDSQENDKTTKIDGNIDLNTKIKKVLADTNIESSPRVPPKASDTKSNAGGLTKNKSLLNSKEASLEEKASKVFASRKPETDLPIEVIAESANVTISKYAALKWQPSEIEQLPLTIRDVSLGCFENLPKSTRRSAREIVLGIDFGTSSTKVVISDLNLERSYAIDFFDAIGIERFLIPSQVWNFHGSYNLVGEGAHSKDLKLSYLSDSNNSEFYSPVCAYLALVIRYARAWLFNHQANQYLNADILWSICIGAPADQFTINDFSGEYKKLAGVAWYLANSEGEITKQKVESVWNKDDIEGELDVEIRIVPEIAAQIHGYVTSTSFDPKASNIYMLVDVGAGTVDGSVFRVLRNNDGSVGFQFFTNSVEALGVMNLHRYRIEWWQKVLSGEPEMADLQKKLSNIKMPIEHKDTIPKTYRDYFPVARITFNEGHIEPDETYFDKVKTQIRSGVFYQLFKAKLLDKPQIQGLPVLLCGGGRRHIFYKRLKTNLTSPTPGAEWFQAKSMELTMPKQLIGNGLQESDYDRLSVAYGLSQIDLAFVQKVNTTLKPAVPVEKTTSYREFYVDKDAC